jgi:predicted DNA-binding protein YlxM (UPF0122 family)
MFTIGGLSKFRIALPLNTTKCWEALTIEIPRYLKVKIFGFGLSAGILRICLMGFIIIILTDTSETNSSTLYPLGLDEGIVHNTLLTSYFISGVNKSNTSCSNKRYYTKYYYYNDKSYHNIAEKQELSPVQSYDDFKQCVVTTAYYNASARQELDAVVIYRDFKKDRITILKEQRNKAGIYYLVNNINGHDYIGSSSNLSGRMSNYLNTSFLKSVKNKNMPIIKALLKYEPCNFSL